MLRLLTVVSLNKEFRGLRGCVYRTVSVIDHRLRFEIERVGVGQMFVLMPTVLACNRPAVSKRRGKRSRGPGGIGQRTLGTAAALEHEAAVPIGRRWQADLEHIAILKAVDASTLVDDALHLAVARQP